MDLLINFGLFMKNPAAMAAVGITLFCGATYLWYKVDSGGKR